MVIIQDCLRTALSRARRLACSSYPSDKRPSLASVIMRVTLLQFHISAAMYVVVDAYKMIVLSRGILIGVLDRDLRRLFQDAKSIRQVDVKVGHSQE